MAKLREGRRDDVRLLPVLQEAQARREQPRAARASWAAPSWSSSSPTGAPACRTSSRPEARMCRHASRGQGPSPRDTLRRDRLRHSTGPRGSTGCRLGDPQKTRSRGEGPLAPPGAVSSTISDSGH
jgi:hypothetical protein